VLRFPCEGHSSKPPKFPRHIGKNNTAKGNKSDRRPVAAFGNSDGDCEMLEYTQSGGNCGLTMLVHHDDAEREFPYGSRSMIGTFFFDELIDVPSKRNWTGISMKNDWKRVFAFEVRLAQNEIVSQYQVLG